MLSEQIENGTQKKELSFENMNHIKLICLLFSYVVYMLNFASAYKRTLPFIYLSSTMFNQNRNAFLCILCASNICIAKQIHRDTGFFQIELNTLFALVYATATLFVSACMHFSLTLSIVLSQSNESDGCEYTTTNRTTNNFRSRQILTTHFCFTDKHCRSLHPNINAKLVSYC